MNKTPFFILLVASMLFSAVAKSMHFHYMARFRNVEVTFPCTISTGDELFRANSLAYQVYMLEKASDKRDLEILLKPLCFADTESPRHALAKISIYSTPPARGSRAGKRTLQFQFQGFFGRKTVISTIYYALNKLDIGRDTFLHIAYEDLPLIGDDVWAAIEQQKIYASWFTDKRGRPFDYYLQNGMHHLFIPEKPNKWPADLSEPAGRELLAIPEILHVERTGEDHLVFCSERLYYISPGLQIYGPYLLPWFLSDTWDHDPLGTTITGRASDIVIRREFLYWNFPTDGTIYFDRRTKKIEGNYLNVLIWILLINGHRL